MVACIFGDKSSQKKKNDTGKRMRDAYVLFVGSFWSAMKVGACKLCSHCLTILPCSASI